MNVRIPKEENALRGRFGPGLIEATNRAEATSILIRRGYRVYRPESDYEGEDIVVKTKSGRCISVQLKSRLRVDKKRYFNKRIWVLFPSHPITVKRDRHWYLIPHDRLYAEIFRRHGKGKGWRDAWGDRVVSEDKQRFLKRWKIGTINVKV